MKCRKAYAIMPIGKKDESAHCGTQKAPEVATPGLFYSVLGPIGKKDESAHCGTQKAPELRPPGLFYSVVARRLMP